LGDVDDVVERALKPVGHDEHDEFDVTVEKCDGAITR
jgi:hypothetical protein